MKIFIGFLLFVLTSVYGIYAEDLTHEKVARHLMEYFSDENDFPSINSDQDCFDYLKRKGIEPHGGFVHEKIMDIDDSVELFGKTIKANSKDEKSIGKNVEQYFRNRMTFIKISGNVLVQYKNTMEWKPVSKGMQVTEGDKIKTENDSWAQLQVGTLGMALLKPSSLLNLSVMQLKIDGVNENIHLDLNVGRMVINVQGMSKKSSFRTGTPSTIVAVRGTIYEVVADQQ